MKEPKMFKRLTPLIAFVAMTLATSQVIAVQTTSTNTVEPLASRLIKKTCQAPFGQIQQKSVTVALYSSEAEDPWFDDSEMDIKFKKRNTGAPDDDQA